MKENKTPNKTLKIIGYVLVAILAAVMAYLSYHLVKNGMLPTKYLLGVVLGMLLLLAVLLVWHIKAKRNIAAIIVTILFIIVIGLGAYYLSTFNSMFDSIYKEDSLGLSDDQVTKSETGAFYLYISGNDSAGELNEKGRSDVNMLVCVNPQTHKILLVNTPRDYYVTLNGIGEKDKLTHAGVYGIETSIKTVGDIYDIQIPYYIRVNFTGFEQIIDALGGVTVNSDYDFSWGVYGFSKGENKLDGAAALAFARERKSFSDGDRQRGRNQQILIQALVDKITSPKILTSYSKILASLSSSIQTNLPPSEISRLVNEQLSEGGSWSVETISVTGSDAKGECYSAKGSNLYIMIPDEASIDAAKERIEEFMNPAQTQPSEEN